MNSRSFFLQWGDARRENAREKIDDGPRLRFVRQVVVRRRDVATLPARLVHGQFACFFRELDVFRSIYRLLRNLHSLSFRKSWLCQMVGLITFRGLGNRVFRRRALVAGSRGFAGACSTSSPSTADGAWLREAVAGRLDDAFTGASGASST